MSCDCDFILLVSAIWSSLFSSGCCKSVTLSATGGALGLGEKQKEWPSYLGKYEATAKKQEGAPVFKKKYDTIYLFRRDGIWCVGEYRVGTVFIRSVGTAQCPASISQWQYWNDGPWHSGHITAVCSF